MNPASPKPKPNTRFNSDMDFTVGRTLGRGATATVSLATSPSLPSPFAVKSAPLCSSSLLRREQSILCSLRSPHVISLLGSSLASDGFHLFLELAPFGSLADEMAASGGRLGEPVIRGRAREILCGLAYLHSVGLAHCDVKPRNVLIGAGGRAKLADFGCARWASEPKGPVLMGTPLFMAPEVARGEEQGTAADVWALGCTIIEMATGRAPWAEEKSPAAALHRIGHSGEVPEVPCWVSDEGRDFLGKCLERAPEKRWTAEKLLDHPFVASGLKVEEERRRLSPKSVLDAEVWESETEEEEEEEEEDGRREEQWEERIRQLASGGPADWGWDGSWVTVRIDDRSLERRYPAMAGDGDEESCSDHRSGEGDLLATCFVSESGVETGLGSVFVSRDASVDDDANIVDVIKTDAKCSYSAVQFYHSCFFSSRASLNVL